jgi:hypothetical protein
VTVTNTVTNTVANTVVTILVPRIRESARDTNTEQAIYGIGDTNTDTERQFNGVPGRRDSDGPTGSTLSITSRRRGSS